MAQKTRVLPPDHFNTAMFSFQQNLLGIPQCPWRSVKKFDELKTAFVMALCNYKLFASIDLSHWTTRKFAIIFDTGLVMSFIKKDDLHKSLWKNIRPSRNSANICETNNRWVNVDDIIDLVVNKWGSAETVRFNLIKHLAKKVILG